MKTRVVLLSKRTVFFSAVAVIGCILFVLMLQQISVNTMNYNDPIYQGLAEQKEVAIGCNVVWGEECLPDILRILKENDAKITFFIGGKWASKNEELLKQIYSEGHEIGNHGYDHKKHSQLSREQNAKEILQTQEIIEKIIGVKTNLFAPPYGDFNDLTVKTAESLNYKVIMWSIDTIDWNTKDYNKILSRINKKHHNGAIVLMHPKEVTVKALPEMIKSLKEKGYKIVPVTEVLE